MKRPTKRALEVTSAVLRAAEDDPLMTIAEVADMLSCSERNARRWLERLDEQGLIRREHVTVERGRRPVSLNRISAPQKSPAPICTPDKPPTNRDQAAEAEMGADAAEALQAVAGLLERGVPGETASRWESLLPPFPGDVCQLAESPAQPVFTGDVRTDVNLMIRAYRCVHKHRTGRGARVDRKARYRLRTAHRSMLDADIGEPYAWALFRFIQHERAGAAPPKIDGVFNSVSPGKFRDWYTERRAAFMQPVCAMTPAHRELVRRWHAARQALMVERPETRLAAQRVVDEHLSQVTYAELTSAARQQLGEMNAHAVRRLAAGEWVWGYAA